MAFWACSDNESNPAKSEVPEPLASSEAIPTSSSVVISGPDMGSGVGYIPNAKFEWYLKNHLGSTMLVYGTVASTDPNTADIGETKAAYDYRAFGEQVELMPHDLAPKPVGEQKPAENI